MRPMRRVRYKGVLYDYAGRWGATGAGSGPADPTNSVQFNNGGAFGGSAKLVWDDTLFRLGIGTATPAALVHARTPFGGDFVAYFQHTDDSATAYGIHINAGTSTGAAGAVNA